MGLFGNIFGTSNYSSSEGPGLSHKAAEKQLRLERYKKTWEAYLAELDDPIVQDGPSNDNVKVNPARALVNTGVYFLFGNEVKFQVSPDAEQRSGKSSSPASNPVEEKSESGVHRDPGSDTYRTQTDKVPNKSVLASPEDPKWLKDLNKVWKANRKKSLLYNLGLSGAIHGTPFVKIIPNGAGMKNEFPRIMLLDPATVDVEWDPNDYTKVVKYCIEYRTEDEEGKEVLRIQEITANQDENEVIQTWSMQWYEHPMTWVINMGWLPLDGEKVPVGPEEIWPYPWAPIEHCQNIELPHMFWGLPDLDESSVEVIESIQRSMSSLNKIVRIHASPRMFAKNVMPDQIDEIDVSADNIITLPNMESDLSVLQTLGNLSPSIDFADKQREMLLEMMQVPPIALGDFESASTAISGVTLSILYAPLLQKTELKRISYGDMLERLNMKLLMLMGHDPEEFDSLIIVWPEAMPGSVYLERQTLEQDQMMGVSEYTLQSKLGYDPVEERKRKMEEQEELMALQKKYAPEPAFGSGGFGNKPGGGDPRGGNNNPAGKGNKSGSMGGTKAAGTPKTKPTN